MKFLNYLRSYETSALTSSKLFRELAEKSGFTVRNGITLLSGEIDFSEGEYLIATDSEGNRVGEYLEEVREFYLDLEDLLSGAEGWDTKEGYQKPFYRSYFYDRKGLGETEVYVIGTKDRVSFIGLGGEEPLETEVRLLSFETSTATSVKRILRSLPATLEELVNDYPEISSRI